MEFFRQLFNNNTIVVNPYGLFSPKITDGLIIAHLSDLHEKSFGPDNAQLFAAVEALHPDIIAVTGDLVAHESQAAADIAYTETFARGLAPIAPCFFVSGNHERQFASEIFPVLEENGFHILHGDVHTLDVRGSRVNISGIHDPVFDPDGPQANVDVFLGTEGYNIFLTHRPEFFEAYAGRNIDLVLAGHTHAGQIRLPKIGSLYMMGQGLFPRYMQGEFTNGDTTMIISRGLGSSGYPTVRLNNPPDLVAVQVTSPPDEGNAQS
ncbi:MAG: metallophosphoesterase [Clostridia bacterium]|nr:metallophosphoesterase [Clostridia bacterium]